LEQSGREGQAQVAIEHHRLRLFAAHQTDGQARVIRQHSANAHQNGIVQGTQLVGEPQGWRAAQTQGFATLKGQAAIQALGVAQGHQRAILFGRKSFRIPEPAFYDREHWRDRFTPYR
jgi:hypothetical protein